jgi:hypothetical protein
MLECVSQFEVEPNPVVAEPKLVTSGGTPKDDNLTALDGTDFNGQSNIVFTGAGKDSVDLSFVSVTKFWRSTNFFILF